MAVDTEAMATAATVESAAPPASALTSESTEAGEAVESPAAGDGQASEPTPGGSSPAEAGPLEEDDDEPTPDETPEQRKTRSERQFENRLKKLASDPEKAKSVLGPILEPLLQEARARDEADRKANQESEQAQQQARQAALARQQKLQEYIGVPDAPGKPGTLSTLQTEIADLNRQIRSELTNPQGIDLDALTTKVADVEARYERTRQNLAMSAEIENYVWDQFGNEFAAAARFPEFGNDPAKQAAYLNAQGGVWGALNVLADTIRSAKDAEKAAALKAQADKHAVEMKAMEVDRNGWRVRAGGEEVADVGTGRAATTGGALTLERYRTMSAAERAKLTPAQRDDMMARHLAQRRAG